MATAAARAATTLLLSGCVQPRNAPPGWLRGSGRSACIEALEHAILIDFHYRSANPSRHECVAFVVRLSRRREATVKRSNTCASVCAPPSRGASHCCSQQISGIHLGRRLLLVIVCKVCKKHTTLVHGMARVLPEEYNEPAIVDTNTSIAMALCHWSFPAACT